jgi:hypothetical protein
MCGSATLATLVSSTSMKVASVTVIAIILGLTGGRQLSCDGIELPALTSL